MNYRTHGPEHRFEGDASILLHVGVENIMCTLVAEVVRPRSRIDWHIEGRPLSLSSLSISYRMGAYGCRSSEGNIEIKESEIKAAVGL